MGDDSHFVFHQKLLGEDRSVRWGIVMVKQPGLFSPKSGATSSHVFKHLPHHMFYHMFGKCITEKINKKLMQLHVQKHFTHGSVEDDQNK